MDPSTIMGIFSYLFNLFAELVQNSNPWTTASDNCIARQDFNDMVSRVRALENSLNNKDKDQVAFSAAVGIGPWHFPPTPYNTDKPLIFNKVITNIGDAYKKDKGHFVAPYDGIYYFVFFVHTGGRNYGTNLYLYKGEERIVQAQNHPLAKEVALNGGNAALLELKADDYVYLRMEKDTHVWASDTHTTFSGFLVERTEDEKADTPT